MALELVFGLHEFYPKLPAMGKPSCVSLFVASFQFNISRISWCKVFKLHGIYGKTLTNDKVRGIKNSGRYIASTCHLLQIFT